MVTDEDDITDAKELLDLARIEGDQLKIDLREAALNDLLERYSVTVVTRHNQEMKSK